jgi:uncharacterized damage-inducible protein DinB
MDANAFRQLYDYHFSENRRLWDDFIAPLPYEKFIRDASYSHGSVRNQVVHIMSVDEAWFSELQDVENPQPFPSPDFDDRKDIRSHWDEVEQNMRWYLAKLKDDLLLEKPIAEGEDKDLILWQILLHVVNHGTDHRAQTLRLLNDLGVKTAPQDFIFYVYDHPQK